MSESKRALTRRPEPLLINTILCKHYCDRQKKSKKKHSETFSPKTLDSVLKWAENVQSLGGEFTVGL